MKRIDTANRELDKFGAGKPGFRAAVPGVSDPTMLSAQWANSVQESIVRVEERAGLEPSDSYDQFADAIQTLAVATPVSRPVSTPNNYTIPPASLTVFARSSAIDVREALPGNFVTDGSVDYSAYVQLILNYFNDFGGGRMYLPPKLALLVHDLNIYTGTEIVANDWTSQFIVPPATGFGMGLSVNYGAAGTADPTTNIRNVLLSGFQIAGKQAAPAFSEFEYLINLNAISDSRLEELKIVGMRGDGIYLGSSNTAHVERHNERIEMHAITIDGINAQNRNGISIIDGTHISMSKLRILNTSKAGMPGAIDIEPNADAFARIQHINLDGFYIDGGNGCGIAHNLGASNAYTAQLQHLVYKNGVVKNKPFGFSHAGGSATPGTDFSKDLCFSKITTHGCLQPFLLEGIHGLLVEDVTCHDSPNFAQLGYVNGNSEVTFSRLKMYNCGSAQTNALQISKATDNLLLDRCEFVDSGRTDVASGRAIYFTLGAGSNIGITNSGISSPAGLTTNPITVAANFVMDWTTAYGANNRFMTGTSDWKPPQPGMRRIMARNYAAFETFDCGLYDVFVLNIQSNLALTYSAPTGMFKGQTLTIRVKNGSGGAMGAITWNPVFKMSAWVNPANGKNKAVTFTYDGAVWQETTQTADVAN